MKIKDLLHRMKKWHGMAAIISRLGNNNGTTSVPGNKRRSIWANRPHSINFSLFLRPKPTLLHHLSLIYMQTHWKCVSHRSQQTILQNTEIPMALCCHRDYHYQLCSRFT